MNTTESVGIAEYVDRPYEQVCELLEAWSGQACSTCASTPMNYVLGDLVRVSRSVARLPIERLGTAEHIAELRVLPVYTGRDAITEILLFVPGSSSMPRAASVRGARALLEAVLRLIETAPVSEAPRLAS